MSFILDQLKRSGKLRKIEQDTRQKTAERSAPEAVILADPGHPAVERTNRAAVISAAVAAAAVIAATGLFVMKKEAPAHRTRTAPAAPIAAPAPSGTTVPAQSTATGIQPASNAKPSAPAQPVPAGTPAPTASKPAAASAVPQREIKSDSAHESGDAREPAAITQTVREIAEQSSEKKVPELDELPVQVRKSLPPVSIGAHIYKEGSRLVSINNRIASEGASLGDGFKVEEITPDGAVLSYGKYRFHVKAR